MSFWDFANPLRFMRLTDRLLPWLAALTVGCLAVGLIWGVFGTPVERVQGASVKLIYIHVPSALMAINAWFMMLVASVIWVVRRHHVSALAARAAAPVGATMCAVALITGAIWGQPTWGTWWVWDPRLTSFAILAVFYLGHIALANAVEAPDLGNDLLAILTMVGTVFALLSRYAVMIWDRGLHQPATLSVDEDVNIDTVFYVPLLISMAGFVLLFVLLVLIRTRTEIRRRRIAALRAHRTAHA